MPIAWRELFAIVLCVSVFGPRMTDKVVKMYTDNQAVLYCINTGTSKDVHLMSLLRSLYYYTTLYKVIYKAYWVSTKDNGPSDSLSRLQYDRFRGLCPQADLLMTQPNTVLLDF